MQSAGMENAPTAGRYLIGLALALMLTAIPFALVYFKLLAGREMLLVIAAAAIIQILVHLKYFLHLDLSASPRENLLTLVFTALIILIMVGGSLWIMFDLHHRMAMPPA